MLLVEQLILVLLCANYLVQPIRGTSISIDEFGNQFVNDLMNQEQDNDDDDLEDNNILQRTLPSQLIIHSVEANKQSDDEIYLLEDKDYPRSVYEQYQGLVGQVAGIATLPTGDVAIFHRAGREWTEETFNGENVLNNLSKAQDNLIKNDTIIILNDEDGSLVTSFGSNLFYMPHGIASDNMGNLWVTDVARHQVMRLPTGSMLLGVNSIASKGKKGLLPGNLTRLWPDIILGEAFVPGSDRAHFCKPSEVVVSPDGRLVFVADGYCNQRVMVFTGTGKFLTSFGEQLDMSVVHSLTLIVERNLICVADRENSRIYCFHAGLDGNLENIGELILKVDYPLGKVYAIEALSDKHMLVSSNQPGTNRYDIAALNPFSSELKQTWASGDLLLPHSLARTLDGRFVYAADISRDAYKKVFKFEIIQRKIPNLIQYDQV